MPFTPPRHGSLTPTGRVPPDGTATASRANTILLVEDTEDAREIMTFILEGAGFRVAPVTCVTEALAELGAGSFDAVVTDYNLPDGTGGQLLDQAIRAGLVDRSHTALLICTASRYVSPLSSVEVIYKPLTAGAFVDAVEKCIGLVTAPVEATTRVS